MNIKIILFKLPFLAFLALISVNSSHASSPKCYEDIENPLLYDVWVPAVTTDQQDKRLENIGYLESFPKPLIARQINSPKLFLGVLPKDIAEKVLPYLGLGELKALKAVNLGHYTIMQAWQNKLIAAQHSCIIKGINDVTHAEKDLFVRYGVKLIPVFVGRSPPSRITDAKNIIDKWTNAQGMHVMPLCRFTRGPLKDFLLTSIEPNTFTIIHGLSAMVVVGAILFTFGPA